jgi:transposase InsO family protein
MDHHLPFTWQNKTFQAYRSFLAWVKTQLRVNIACLHADRGGEYLSEEFSKFLTENGTNWKLTVHDTPEDNGVAERLN